MKIRLGIAGVVDLCSSPAFAGGGLKSASAQISSPDPEMKDLGEACTTAETEWKQACKCDLKRVDVDNLVFTMSGSTGNGQLNWDDYRTDGRPAKRDGKNPFPDDGPHLSDEQLDAIPDYDRDKQYTYGALVKDGFSSEPHEMAFRCGQEKCDDGPPGDGWVSAGWY